MIEEYSGQFIKLKNYCLDNNLLQDHTIIIIALSGGIDSIVLLYFLLWLKERKIYQNLIIKAAHLNHMIREEANEDQAFVEKLCLKLNVQCHIKKINVPQLAVERKKGIEEAGRHARHEFFKDLQKSYFKKAKHENFNVKIAFGHHQDDLAESVIMNIGRGSGISGISTLKNKENSFIRPLLDLSKEEIITLAEKNNWQWVEDQTNESDDYLRNRIRNHLIPMWNQTVGYDIKPLLARLSNNIKNDELALNWASQEAYKSCLLEENIFNLQAIRFLPKSILKKVLESALTKHTSLDKKLSHIHINQVWQLVQGKHGNKQISLGDGITIYRKKNQLRIFYKNRDPFAKQDNIN